MFSQSYGSSVFPASPSFAGLAFTDINGGVLGSSFSQASLPAADPNSPEAFKQNIQLALTQVARAQELARSAKGMNFIVECLRQNAYRPGSNPVQTTTNMTALHQALQLLAELLRQSGVGALPLQPPDLANPSQEEHLIEETSKVVQALFERQKRLQEGAGVVASLLSAGEREGRR